ncbi:MAG: hypothetical protein HZC02_03255 [Candidatus Levybacteria bacterium]|nr:hypothetical protein [Candidatus Levybacteria bacterium]
MTKTFFLVISILAIILLGGVVGIRYFKNSINTLFVQSANQKLIAPSPTPIGPVAQKIHETLFVPYWSFSDNSEDIGSHATVVYFGLGVNSHGVVTSDEGYKKLPSFVSLTKGSKKILAVRMTDTSSNTNILKDKKAQETIVSEVITIARDNGFDGILLNIEVSALPFTSLINQITAFNTLFADRSHAGNLTYSITAYGDTFYRARPFDMKKLGEKADHVYVMAYDFHKAKGNPGPNFPLKGNDVYGYDMERMINNFANVVDLKKLVVIFGMYGYDWVVDEKDVAQEIGAPLSLLEVSSGIVDNCNHDLCSWERDGISSETKAVYEDEGQKHVVWFEDKESVKRKQEFLKQHGIGEFAYWAYSYF